MAPQLTTLLGLGVLFALVLMCSHCEAGKVKDERECEVCIGFLDKFSKTLSDEDRQSKGSVEKKLRSYCKDVKSKEERFCFYIGARVDSATSTIGDVSTPLTYFMPAATICNKLKAKDAQICDLKYDKQLDLVNADLKKMRVKELKKILMNWGEDCRGCTEKDEYIRRVNDLMPSYAPEAHAARQAKSEL